MAFWCSKCNGLSVMEFWNIFNITTIFLYACCWLAVFQHLVLKVTQSSAESVTRPSTHVRPSAMRPRPVVKMAAPSPCPETLRPTPSWSPCTSPWATGVSSGSACTISAKREALSGWMVLHLGPTTTGLRENRTTVGARKIAFFTPHSRKASGSTPHATWRCASSARLSQVLFITVPFPETSLSSEHATALVSITRSALDHHNLHEIFIYRYQTCKWGNDLYDSNKIAKSFNDKLCASYSCDMCKLVEVANSTHKSISWRYEVAEL